MPHKRFSCFTFNRYVQSRTFDSRERSITVKELYDQKKKNSNLTTHSVLVYQNDICYHCINRWQLWCNLL